MACYVPGEIIVLPALGGARLEKERELRLLYSIRDILDFYRPTANEYKQLGSQPTKMFPSYPEVFQVPPGSEVETAERLTKSKLVEAAAPNYLVTPLTSSSGPASVVRMNEIYLRSACSEIDVGTVSPMCGNNVKIALMDTGVDPAAIPWAKNVGPVQYDVSGPLELKGFLQPSDDHGHGTLVAGILSMISPGTIIHSIKVAGSGGNLGGVIAGLFLAEEFLEPDIINASFRLHAPPRRAEISYEQARVLFFSFLKRRRAIGPFVRPLIVASAGNGVPGSMMSIVPPASYPDVLAVGAWGSATGGAAPYSVYSTIPLDRFIRAPGGGSADSECVGWTRAIAGRGRPTKKEYGTSFASAFVSGVAARYACGLLGGACRVGKSVPTGTGWELLMDCLRGSATATTENSGGNGWGTLRYDRDQVARVLARNNDHYAAGMGGGQRNDSISVGGSSAGEIGTLTKLARLAWRRLKSKVDPVLDPMDV